MKLTISEPEATRLSEELRCETGNHLGTRRAIVGCSLLASACMGIIALYQMGLVKRLPEPPLPKMDAEKVDAAAEAYKHLEMPDAVLGLGSYAVTMGLAAMDGKERAKRQPWLPLALAGKTLLDALKAAQLTRNQAVRQKAYCFWCLLAATATFVSLPLAFAEARAAFRQVLKR